MHGPHLGHRLPWLALADVAKSLSMASRRHLIEQEEKTVEYFARCLADAIKEFAETDTTSYEDKDKFDPHRQTVWDVEYDTGRGAYVGYYDSLLYGYVHLNILLLDPNTWKHVVLRENGHWNDAMELLCGRNDGGHPEWLANHIRPIFDERGYLKPVTAEVVEIMRSCVIMPSSFFVACTALVVP